MAALADGVYVSRVDSEEWEPDDETGGWVHMLFEEGEAMGGMWKPGPAAGPAEGLPLHARETIVVLQGVVRIEIEGGPTLELGVGDMASMPKGAVTTWHPSPDFKEVWVYS